MIAAFIMPLQKHVKDLHITMIGESEVTYSAFLLLFHQPVENTVVHKPLVEILLSILSSTDSMKEHVVDIVYLQIFQGVLKHLDTCSPGIGIW